MDVSVSETIDQKTYLKNLGGASASLAPPLDPPMPSPKIKPQRKTASFTRKTTFFKECN